MYASLYPSLIRQFNIAAHTQIGMLIIPEQVYENENKAKLGNWTRASEFMENFQSQMWLEICCRWFHLANYTELYHEIEEFFTTVANPYNGLKSFDRNGYIIPMVFDQTGLMQEVVIFEDTRRPVEDIYVRPDLFKWEEWRNNALKYGNQHF